MNLFFSKLRFVCGSNSSVMIAMMAVLPLLVACADVSPVADSSKKNASSGTGFTPATPITTVPLPTTVPPATTNPGAGATAVNGQCANFSGVSVPVAPTSGLCAVGTPTSVATLSAGWQWSCIGSNGGRTDASCTIAKSAAPVTPVGASPFAYQSAIVVGIPDEFVRINTGVSTTEEAYGCMQKNSDSTYPCQNGNIASKFTLANAFVGSTRVWLSTNFYADVAADFGDYTVIIMKKNANGVLTDVIAALPISIRLPELAPNQYWSESGGAWSSSSGSNKVYASCRMPNVAFQLSPGFIPYPYISGKECYYKIVR